MEDVDFSFKYSVKYIAMSNVWGKKAWVTISQLNSEHILGVELSCDGVGGWGQIVFVEVYRKNIYCF